MCKSRLLVVVPSSAYGGGEEYIYQLLNCELFTEIYDVVVLSACVDLNSKLRALDIEVYEIDDFVKLSLNTFVAIRKINNLISTRSIDSVLLNGLPEVGVYSKFISCRSVTVICHSNESWLNNTYQPLLRRLKLMIAGNFSEYIFRLVVVSPQAYRNVEDYDQGLFEKTIYLRNTVPAVDRNSGRHIENLGSSGGVVFGRISRLCAGKGNEMLIHAFSKIFEKFPSARLLISGDGEQRIYLQKLSSDLGVSSSVFFSGHIEKETFYKNIDCMLSPSDMEAMPMVIVEALSCGVPVIATDVGGVSSLIDNNSTGVLIPPKDPDSLYLKMEEFILDRHTYELYSEEGLRKYREEMSYLKFVSDLADVIGRRY